MVIGALRITLLIPECHSLKDKRRVVKQLIERTRNRFSVAIAETGLLDDHSRAEVGLAAVGNDRRVINSVLDKATGYIDSLGTALIVDRELELLNI
ncbi:MAG: DUF503 domain-containing protein [Deltaproteobacteria bacterium]|nr:DUF503 domain-containing protein [Deltaproteobacteria bacterium]